jgi:uncharacterized protein YecE (DUF72 family)
LGKADVWHFGDWVEPEKQDLSIDELKRLRQLARRAKREKQREASYGRAAKMHAARLELPLPPPSLASPRRHHIGCSGWFYWHWRSLFYPDVIPRTDWFPYYARHFDTVELNAPFYSWPTLATVNTWLRQAEHSPNFVYTVKVSELITHVMKFEGTAELVQDFGYIADMLGPRFGCFLFQLPPSFSFTRERLEAIVSQLEPNRRNVVEFRHASWWNEKVYRAFESHGIIFCSCSGPKLPEELIKTAEDIYVRFHGTGQWYRHDYSLSELKTWAERIRQSGAVRSWIYFNNDREGFAIKNGQQLRDMLDFG